MIPVVLAIAGSDSSGGAGIQADLRTLAALDVHPAAAVTAVTAQDTRGVRAWRAVDTDLVRAQIRAVLDDLRPAAIKTGMLATADIVRAVSVELAACDAPLVCDPVLASSSGRALLEPDGVEALRDVLLRRVTVLTPNAHEAAALTGHPVRDPDEAEEAARTLCGMGALAVLVKGGHLAGPTAIDVLATPDGILRLEGPRLDTPHTHGTGCVTASAIAALLARGVTVREAVERAKRFVTEAIRRGGPLGAGAGAGAVRPPREEPRGG